MEKIIVIGDLMLDKFTLGTIEKINPEKIGAPLVRVEGNYFYIGGAANVANNLASLGVKTFLYGGLGNDSFSKIFKKISKKKKNIFLRSFQIGKTILKQRLMVNGEQIARIDFEEKNLTKISKKLEIKILKKLKKDSKKAKAIILSDYNKQIFTESISKKIINFANKKGIKTIVDPKPKNINFFKGCTAVCPNKKEAEEISGIKYSNKNRRKILEKIQKITNAEYVIVTCGEKGVIGYSKKERKEYLVPTIAKKIKDVTGAGDTFASTFTFCLVSGKNFEESLSLANKAAGLAVEKTGTSTISRKELFS